MESTMLVNQTYHHLAVDSRDFVKRGLVLQVQSVWYFVAKVANVQSI